MCVYSNGKERQYTINECKEYHVLGRKIQQSPGVENIISPHKVIK